MNLFRKELLAIALALTAVAFTIGFMVGRAGNVPEVQVVAAVSSLPAAASASALPASASPDASAFPKASVPPASGVLNTSVVNINTAALEELMTLEGIGETLAGRIIAYRTKNGAFQSIDGIMDVSGIGEGKFEKIKSRITVG